MTVIPLNYKKELIDKYQGLKDLPGFVLLESIDKHRGRYDIVTALPYCVIQENDLDKLKSYLPEEAPSFGDFPFQGGAIGYISYSLAEDARPSHPANHWPLMSVGLYDWAIVVCHHNKTAHLVSADRQAETKAILEDMQKRWHFKATEASSFELLEPFMPLIHKKDYQEAFAIIHEALVLGRAYQVCYTQPFLARYQGDPWAIYRRIRASNPVPYAAFMKGEMGYLICFSPEHFLSIEGQVVRTSPIKGTIGRSSSPKKDKLLRTSLLQSSKNKAENLMIVDLLRNDLSRFALPHSVQVKALCELQSYGGLHHLVSHIVAEKPKSLSAMDVFKACFPGGSITGAPKIEAMNIIRELEPYARGVYCGNFFYLSQHGRFESNIAIRTMSAMNETLYLSAGGGIVIDSTWEEEYQECLIKISAIKKALTDIYIPT